MTTAISDMMALLGSLKESPFFRSQLPPPLDLPLPLTPKSPFFRSQLPLTLALHANCGLGSSE